MPKTKKHRAAKARTPKPPRPPSLRTAAGEKTRREAIQECEARVAVLERGSDPAAIRKPAPPKKPRRVSALDAAATILATAKEGMRATQLIEAMATRGLWTSPGGKTPEATLYAAIAREIAKKGTSSRFARDARGHFVLAGGAK